MIDLTKLLQKVATHLYEKRIDAVKREIYIFETGDAFIFTIERISMHDDKNIKAAMGE